MSFFFFFSYSILSKWMPLAMPAPKFWWGCLGPAQHRQHPSILPEPCCTDRDRLPFQTTHPLRQTLPSPCRPPTQTPRLRLLCKPFQDEGSKQLGTKKKNTRSVFFRKKKVEKKKKKSQTIPKKETLGLEDEVGRWRRRRRRRSVVWPGGVRGRVKVASDTVRVHIRARH